MHNLKEPKTQDNSLLAGLWSDLIDKAEMPIEDLLYLRDLIRLKHGEHTDSAATSWIEEYET